MMRLINFELLLAVEVLSEESSYPRAAQKPATTLSLLRSRIAALEDQLEFHVFETDGKEVKVTPEGQAFINAAGAFLREAKRIKTHGQGE
jgi:DNA-binding transcriptional LysR family regulator